MNSSPLFDSHDNQLLYHAVKKEDLLYDPDFYFQYMGLKFISFSQLYKMKINRNAEKDRNDCKAMKAFLTNDVVQLFISRTKQNIFYIRIKCKHLVIKKLIYLLKITRMYSVTRSAYRIIRRKHEN